LKNFYRGNNWGKICIPCYKISWSFTHSLTPFHKTYDSLLPVVWFFVKRTWTTKMCRSFLVAHLTIFTFSYIAVHFHVVGGARFKKM
jgi:hypothetical protein